MKSALEKYLEGQHHKDCPVKALGALTCTCGLDAARSEFERLKEVVKTTRETRAAQKTYYDGGRLQGDLRKAKQKEKELDLRLSRLWSQEPSADTMQERLL